MALSLVAIAIALACASASAQRLRLAAGATWIDPGPVLDAIRGERSRARVAWDAIAEAIRREPMATWERAWLDATGARDGEAPAARAARVNEELAELDYASQRWARVPRVAARVATTSGFLLASLAMCSALTAESIDVSAVITGAINAITVGVAGAVFCVAIDARARALVKNRLAAMDRLVDRVEALLEANGADALDAVAPRAGGAEGIT